jgi:ABC-type glycerol-3-phosphate transport system permease component
MVGLTLAISALLLPFTLLLMEGYLRTIPSVYEEAAMIDGLSRVSAFFRITLPLAMPGIVTVWLLSFIGAWGEFTLPLFIMRGSPEIYPASTGLLYIMVGAEAGRKIQYDLTSAFSILYSIPVLVVFLVVRRFLVKGIAGLASRYESASTAGASCPLYPPHLLHNLIQVGLVNAYHVIGFTPDP